MAQSYTRLSLDSTYSEDGISFQNLDPNQEWVTKSIPLGDGSMLVLSTVRSEGTTYRSMVYRLDRFGLLDHRFGSGQGYVEVAQGISTNAVDIIVFETNKVLVLVEQQLDRHPVLAVMDLDGVADVAFDNVKILSSIATYKPILSSVCLGSHGELLIGGSCLNQQGMRMCIVLSLRPESGYSATFYTIKNESGGEHYQKLLKDANRFYLLGFTISGAKSYYTVLRTDYGFLKDTDFSVEGKAFFGLGENDEMITDGVLDNNKRLLVLCKPIFTKSENENFAIARLVTNVRQPKSHLDPTFNSTGVRSLQYKKSYMTKILVDKDDFIYVTGFYLTEDGTSHAFIMRLMDNGLLDSSFCEKGFYFFDGIPSASTADFYIQDRTIIVVGTSGYSEGVSDSKTYVAKLKIVDYKLIHPTITWSNQTDLYCGHQEIPISLTSNSPAQLTWHIASGPVEKSGNKLLINGLGTIQLDIHQDTQGIYTQLDTTISLQASCEVKVFEYVTPNGDGANDTFTIQNIEFFPENRVAVYNKWQQEIYSAKGYKNMWQPTHLPAGVYYYLVQINPEEKPYKGIFLLEDK